MQNVCVYGIEFSLEELKQLRDSDVCNEISNHIRCDDMINIWYEMEDCAYHFDMIIEKNIKFIIGYDNKAKGISNVEMDIKIKELCKKYKLVYSKPKMVLASY